MPHLHDHLASHAGKVANRFAYHSPVRWASLAYRHVPTLARPAQEPLRWVADRAAPRGTTILLLACPRSGSSWIGRCFASADDALYLREPINAFHKAVVGPSKTVIPLDSDAALATYSIATRRAFAALPVFPKHVVPEPWQWSLLRRARGRLIIKEVNPLAAGLFLAYRPIVILLVRHPAAVASSRVQLGWDDGAGDSWSTFGAWYGSVLAESARTLETYPEARVITYEDLCREPLEILRGLFTYTQLDWNARVERAVTDTLTGDSDRHWGTNRDTSAMADAWRGKLDPDALMALRDGYASSEPPLYLSDSDW